MFVLNPQIIKVSQLNRYVKALLDENKLLSDVMVKGELTSVGYHSQSGHYYFTIGDETAMLRCVMFARYAERLFSFPEEGSIVLVRGALTIYEREGQYQLLCYDIQSMGQGGGIADLTALRSRLMAEGLLAPERKRPIPQFPQAIGVITSGSGAALQDIITGMQRHNDTIPLIVYPATVQGDHAVESMLSALSDAVDEARCDVIILGRGGGASETLAVFNDERLLRAVAECPIPVISAVGHDVDITLMDEVADVRAATPTAACQYSCISKSAVMENLREIRQNLLDAAEYRTESAQRQFMQNFRLLKAKSPQNLLNKNRQKLQFLIKLLQESMEHTLWRKQESCRYLTEQLRLLNPGVPLERGYSITTRFEAVGKPLRSCREASVGQKIETRLRDGILVSVVQEIRPIEEEQS